MSGKARKRVSIKTTNKMKDQINSVIDFIMSFYRHACADRTYAEEIFSNAKTQIESMEAEAKGREIKEILRGFIRRLNNIRSKWNVVRPEPEPESAGEGIPKVEMSKKEDKALKKEVKKLKSEMMEREGVKKAEMNEEQNEMELLREYLNKNSEWNEKIEGYVDTILNSEEKFFPFIRKDKEFIKKTLEDLCMEYVFEEIKNENKNFDASEENKDLSKLIEVCIENAGVEL